MKTISVCLIVKNEEKVLKRCLDSVKSFADEIIIVDTGSTDNTIDIAKKYTSKIYNFEWRDDFSMARNYGLKYAKCDYIMWIDADDVIDKKNIKKIINLKQNLKYETYMLKYQVAFDNNGKPTFEYYRERIVKNCDSAKFNGFVHECITPFGRIEYTDIVIKNKKIETNREQNRNLKLYNKHIKNGNKLNAREMFYYAKELFYNKYYSKAIVIFKKYLKMKNQWWPKSLDSYVCLSDCYLYKNNLQKSKNTLLECLKIAPPSANLCCKLGYLYVCENNYNYAIFWYKTALVCSFDEKSGSFIEKDYYNFIPYLQLSFCYYNINDYTNFKKYHNLAKKIKPYNPAIIHNQQFIKQ